MKIPRTLGSRSFIISRNYILKLLLKNYQVLIKNESKLIKSEVETVISMLQAIYTKHQEGEMSVAQARKLGADLLRELR